MKKLILLLSVLVLILSSCSSIKTTYEKEYSVFVDVGAVTYPNKDLDGNIDVITRVIYDDWQTLRVDGNKNGAILVKIPIHKSTDIQSVEVTIINNTENNLKGMVDTYFYVGNVLSDIRNYKELYYSTDYLDNKLTYKFDYKKLINNLK